MNVIAANNFWKFTSRILKTSKLLSNLKKNVSNIGPVQYNRWRGKNYLVIIIKLNQPHRGRGEKNLNLAVSVWSWLSYALALGISYKWLPCISSLKDRPCGPAGDPWISFLELLYMTVHPDIVTAPVTLYPSTVTSGWPWVTTAGAPDLGSYKPR